MTVFIRAFIAFVLLFHEVFLDVYPARACTDAVFVYITRLVYESKTACSIPSSRPFLGQVLAARRRRVASRSDKIRLI
jgi:hypothetical protein